MYCGDTQFFLAGAKYHFFCMKTKTAQKTKTSPRTKQNKKICPYNADKENHPYNADKKTIVFFIFLGGVRVAEDGERGQKKKTLGSSWAPNRVFDVTTSNSEIACLYGRHHE